MRRKDLNNYVKRADGKGYDYKGSYFAMPGTAGEVKKRKMYLVAIPVAAAALFVAMGVGDTGASSIMYVVLPYVCMMLPVALMIANTARLFVKKGDLTEREHKIYVRQTDTCSIALSVLALMVLVGEGIFVALGGDFARETLFVTMDACLAILGFGMHRILAANPCTEKKPATEK